MRSQDTCFHAPLEIQALWVLIGMGSMLAGSLGVPLTAILFSLEVTHNLPALLPLAIACIASYLVTALIMPRSILTEKLSRRGYHLSREYGVDPLELVLVKEVMSPAAANAAAVPLPSVFVYADATTRDAAEIMATEGLEAVPVVDRKTGQVCGVLSIRDLLQVRGRSRERENERLRLFWHVPPEIGGHP